MSLINASPTKGFFVNMLTRDIDLDDAILDLLDNSLDGLLRQEPGNTEQPYQDYTVDISISKDEFIIEDNCGGIPTEIAENYAFRMGKPPAREDDGIPTVGMFGIGMKRAVFKMGQDISIISKNSDKCFCVNIGQDWLESDNSWDLTMVDCNDEMQLDNQGTKIIVHHLYPGISEKFTTDSGFLSTLAGKIKTHYAYIIKKGLNINVNGQPISGNPIKLLVSQNAIDGDSSVLPFVYTEEQDGVRIRIIVGLTGQPPGLIEEDKATENSLPTESSAGWTIICNERVVLYADRSFLTGWGDGLPRFHYQFNTIVGIVEFSSNDASKLPVTTTKRGIDASTDLYLRVRKRMIEGMRIFVDYTNKWKNLKGEESITVISRTKAESLDSLSAINLITKKSTTVRDGSDGKIFKPTLPTPPSSKPTSRVIRFSKSIAEIQMVSEFLFSESNEKPSEVGEACFDYIFEETKK